MIPHALRLAALALLSLLSVALRAAVFSRADFEREIAPLLEQKAIQAASIAVIRPGETLTAHFGQLAPDDAAAPDDETVYEIGSITKVFTSLLLADAVVRGEVALDTPIAKLLPSDVALPDGAGERITLRMLATHTSGLPRLPADLPTNDYANPYARYGEPELWATMRRVRLDFEPGTKAVYSNLAAGLLGTLLARHTGVPYEQLLRERILAPLGMTHTGIALDAEQHRRLAPPFTGDGKPWSTWDFQALAGAGGIRSTLPDMIRFARALLKPDETPLREAIELAWAPQQLAATVSPGGQALGWMIAGDRDTRWHNGMTGGFHAAIFVNRADGVATVLLTNRSHPRGTQLAEKIFRAASGRAARPVPNATRPEVTLTPEQIDRCVGTFRLSAKMTLVCERRHDALFVTPTGQPTDRLFAAASDTFFSRRAPVELKFELLASGEAAPAVLLIQGGRQTRAVRE